MINDLVLSKNIYTLENILLAIDAYSSICEIIIEEKSEYYVLIINKCILDPIVACKEFENYLIGLSGKYGY